MSLPARHAALLAEMSLRSLLTSALLLAACGPSKAPAPDTVALTAPDVVAPSPDAAPSAPAAAAKGMPSTYDGVRGLLPAGSELAGVRRARSAGGSAADAEEQGRAFVVRADLDGNGKDDLALIAEGAPSEAGTVTRSLMVFTADTDGVPQPPLSVDFGAFAASGPEPMSIQGDGAVLKIGRITGEGAQLRNERFDIAWLDGHFVFVGYQALLPGEGERVPYAVDLTTGKGKRGTRTFEATPAPLVRVSDFKPGLDLMLTPKAPRTALWVVFGGLLAAQDRVDEPLPMPVDGAVRVFGAGKQVCLAKTGEVAAVGQDDLVAGTPDINFKAAPLTATEGDCKGGSLALPVGAPEPWVYRAEPARAKLREEALVAAQAHPTWQREQAAFVALGNEGRFEDHIDGGALAELEATEPESDAQRKVIEGQMKAVERAQKAITVERLVPNDAAAEALVLVSADWAEGHYRGGASIVLRVGAEGELTPVASMHRKIGGVIDLERDGKPEFYTTMRCFDAIDEVFAWDESLPTLDSAEQERTESDRRAAKLIESPFACGD